MGSGDSRYQQSWSATSVPNYQNLTYLNFWIRSVGYYYQYGQSLEYNTKQRFDFSYNASTGVVSLNRFCNYWTNLNNQKITNWFEYDVYAVY